MSGRFFSTIASRIQRLLGLVTRIAAVQQLSLRLGKICRILALRTTAKEMGEVIYLSTETGG